MIQSTNKPSVTKAFKAVVYPIMEKDGYTQLSTKRYARLVDNEILQEIFIHVDSRLKRSYEVHYCSLLLSEPHESLSLEIGGKFEKLSAGYSYGASSEKLLNTTIKRVAIAYKEDASRKLQKSASLSGLKDAYLELMGSHNYINPNTLFSLACVYAALDDKKSAIKYAKNAHEEFLSTYNSNPDRDWALEKSVKAQELERSLVSGNYADILTMWREYTISNLKLKKLINPAAKPNKASQPTPKSGAAEL